MHHSTVLVLSATLALFACQKAEEHGDHAGHGDQAGTAASAQAAPSASAKSGPTAAERRAAAAWANAALGKVTKSVVAATEKEPEEAPDTLPLGGEAPPKKLPASTKPVPASADAVKGKSYAPQAADWESWKHLPFASKDEMPCQLEWTAASDADGKVSAKCDLDGDGKLDYHVEQAIAVVGGEVKVAASVVEVIALPAE